MKVDILYGGGVIKWGREDDEGEVIGWLDHNIKKEIHNHRLTIYKSCSYILIYTDTETGYSQQNDL